jgi:hypothetical protein
MHSLSTFEAMFGYLVIIIVIIFTEQGIAGNFSG